PGSGSSRGRTARSGGRPLRPARRAARSPGRRLKCGPRRDPAGCVQLQGAWFLPLVHGAADGRDGGEPHRACAAVAGGLAAVGADIRVRVEAQDGALFGRLTRIGLHLLAMLTAPAAGPRRRRSVAAWPSWSVPSSPGRATTCSGPAEPI